jgi:pimeloyl-ACP methyl ester carboxylesterase
MDQQIQYCTTPDGVRLAYSVTGKGSPIVRPSHWLTHLEYDLKSPVWRHLVVGLSQRHSLVRFDARGEGMSQRDVSDVSFERWVSDLETVVDKLALAKFALLGISQSASVAITYATRHPERVSHLILYGGFARGLLHRGSADKQKDLLELNRTMVREGWGSDHDVYRQWFTSQFIPGGTAEQARWFNELERMTATPEMAEKHVVTSAGINVLDLLPKVSVPTLVLHCRGDLRVEFSRGEELAANIPGAKFVPLEGNNHLFLAEDPAYRSFLQAVAAFLGDPPIKGTLPGTKNRRERLETAVANMEKSWIIKVIIIVAAITGVVIFGLEIWKLMRHH